LYLDKEEVCAIVNRGGDGRLDGGSKHQPLRFGFWEPNRTYLDGEADDIRIYDRALSKDEIDALVDQTEPAPDAPAPPTDLKAEAGAAARIDLSWSHSGPADGFAIERKSAASGAAFVPLIELPAGTPAYGDTGLEPATLYVYRLRALGPGGFSAHSNEAAAMTLSDGPPPPVEGLVGRWALDETEGEVAHDAAGGHAGFLIGDPACIAGGRIGGALRLDGRKTPRDQVDLGRSADYDPVGAVTVAAWLRLANLERTNAPEGYANAPVIVKPESYALSLSGQSTRPLFSIRDVQAGGDDTDKWGNVVCRAESDEQITDTDWHHLAGTYDPASRTLTLYLDGRPICRKVTDGGDGRIDATNGSLALGYSRPNRSYLNGDLDEACVFDRALSGEEVFQLAAGRTCDASPPDPAADTSFLYWTSAHSVQRAGLPNLSVETLVTSLSDAIAVAVDPAGGRVYYANRLPGVLYRANPDGSAIETLYNDDAEIWGLAVDPAGKVYWASYESGGPGHIRRANLDGSQVEDLAVAGWPLDVALDLSNGKVYWARRGPNRLERANLDGSEREVVLDRGTAWAPFRLDLDRRAGRLYWVENDSSGRVRMLRAGLDGSNVEAVIDDPLVQPSGLAVDPEAGFLYWSDRNAGAIRRAGLDGTGVEDLLVSLLLPSYLALQPGIAPAGAFPVR
jgi:DNA-binding beta-propeller fold protein YncE